jgi:hypothetical protein
MGINIIAILIKEPELKIEKIRMWKKSTLICLAKQFYFQSTFDYDGGGVE